MQETDRALRGKPLRHRLIAFALGALAVAQGGCGSSDPSRFYQLAQTGRPGRQMDQAWRPDGLVVGIGPIRVPDYLDRPEIVSVSGEEMIVADFDRWVGSLEDDITRALVTDVSSRLPADHFFVTPWSARSVPLSYRVEVQVESYAGPLEGPVFLKARWWVFAHDRRLLLGKSSSISEAVRGTGYGALVEAMRRALEGLSAVIAGDIKSLTLEAAP